MVRVNLDPYDEGKTHTDFILYGIFASIGGALIMTVHPAGFIGIFLGVPVLIIGLIWMAIAPKKTMGENRIGKHFWSEIVMQYESRGKDGVLKFLRSRKDNLQTKGARRFLRNQMESKQFPDPHLEAILEAVEEYCNDPENSSFRW